MPLFKEAKMYLCTFNIIVLCIMLQSLPVVIPVNMKSL